MSTALLVGAFALASCASDGAPDGASGEPHDGTIRGMADQVARQDAFYATYFSVERFLSGTGRETVESDDELEGILFEELPDLTVGPPFAQPFALNREWGLVVELADVEAIYDQPLASTLLIGEFDASAVSDRIEQLPDGEVDLDEGSGSWTTLRYSASPLADGGDAGLGRAGTLAISGNRMILADPTTDPDEVTRTEDAPSAVADAGVDDVASRLDEVEAYAAVVFYRGVDLGAEDGGGADLRSSWSAAGFATAVADGTERAHTVLWHENESDALGNSDGVESLMAEHAQCIGDVTVNVDDRLLAADCRVDRPGGWASDVLGDEPPPYASFLE